MRSILVVYYSLLGSTEALAREVCRGVDSHGEAEAVLRTVPAVSSKAEATQPAVPPAGPPYASAADLADCDGLILGSPTRFGNMAAALKYFIDGTSGEWLSGALSGKPGAVFTSTTSMHGGQETTLVSMALPLIHHGMLWCGLPYTEAALSETERGGTPYGASQVSAGGQAGVLDTHEATLAFALGARVADVAVRLARS